MSYGLYDMDFYHSWNSDLWDFRKLTTKISSFLVREVLSEDGRKFIEISYPQKRATQNIDIIPHSHVLPITHIELLTAFQHNLFSLYFKQGSPNSLWSGFKPSDQDQSDPRESLLKTLNTLGNPNSTRDDWNRKFLKPKADLYTYMDQRFLLKNSENDAFFVLYFYYFWCHLSFLNILQKSTS